MSLHARVVGTGGYLPEHMYSLTQHLKNRLIHQTNGS